MGYLPLIQLLIFGFPILTLASKDSKHLKSLILGHFELAQALIEFAILRPLSECELKALRHWRPNKKFKILIKNDFLKNSVSLMLEDHNINIAIDAANNTDNADETDKGKLGDFVVSIFTNHYYLGDDHSLVG
ncbi:4728_t:CDS:1 [Gigaspora margarita]|uniref:4728_t:CDS:1 n=1 Tax=Gigaspora margarita TaxID=4874 RepID=A0ABN7VCM9_GIGMA|nr:4728_t:CDS:1 [Gigaspora margarita]